MPVSPYRPTAFERLVVFLSAERARTATVAITRSRPLCPDKSSK
jgi:hypothetical protein